MSVYKDSDRLKMPLPNATNFLQEDVGRLIQTITILDQSVATIDSTTKKLDEAQIPDSVARLRGVELDPSQIPVKVVQVGNDGKIPVTKLPASAVSQTLDASNQAAMLLLPANIGDFCRRLDSSKIFELVNLPATTLNNWREQPLTVVTSVNGQAGDIADIATKDDLDKRAGGYISQVFWHHNRAVLPDGCIAGDGQLLSRGTNAALFDLVQRNQVPVCDDTDWLNDPSKRGCYTLGDGISTFRVPDYNGAYSDGKSIVAPFMRGDGGAGNNNGVAQPGAVPNLKGSFQGRNYGRANTSMMNAIDVFPGGSQTSVKSGPFNYASYIGDTWANVGDFTDLTATPAAKGPNAVITFDASTASSVYGDGINEVRPNAVIGCYVIRFMGGAVINAPLDASTLATRIEQINTDLMNYRKVVTSIDNQVGYALVDFGLVKTGWVGATPNQWNPERGRYVQPNPFGPNTPVICKAEIFNGRTWVDTGWIFNNITSPTPLNASYGVRASYKEGEGIVVQCGTFSLTGSGSDAGGTGNGHVNDDESAAAISQTPTRCRVHVWCVGSDLSGVKTTVIDPLAKGLRMTLAQAVQTGWIRVGTQINTAVVSTAGQAIADNEVMVTVYNDRMTIQGLLRSNQGANGSTPFILPYGIYQVLKMPAGKSLLRKPFGVAMGVGMKPNNMGINLANTGQTTLGFPYGTTWAPALFTRPLTGINQWVTVEGVEGSVTTINIDDTIYFD
ncbi:tail fiber protein [Salmonella enterica subsp. enterica serovar Typhimurium]|nr:tail fiber protein [Salmonella enterica subsp. enterica serovar Typhimurium]